MARTIRNAKIDTRSARAKLKARREPYWTSIQSRCAMGYRKGATGGTWIARFYNPDVKPKLRYHALGAADDAMDGDSALAFSFSQAQEQARVWFAQVATDGNEEQGTGPYTVRMAIEDYFESYKRRHAQAAKAAEFSSNAHIIPAFGETEVTRLSTKAIRNWHHKLAETPARLRSRTGEPNKFRETADDPETRRKRQSTANHILTILKAALNHAWREGKVASDDAWRRVKPFRDVESPIVRYLTAAECKRLVNACTEDFRSLARAAIFTGCRYGELAALRVSDFNPDAGTLTVRTSKSGKPRHVVLTDEAQAFFADVTAGRTGTSPIFSHTDGKLWGKSHQQRPLADACKRAKISPAISFHVLRHTHGSLLAMQGVPMPVIARQLGHADTRMTEKHYAHLSPDYVADTIRAHFPKLGIGGSSTVARLA